MPRRRDTLLILLAALVLALLAWLFLAREKSDAPEGPPGAVAPAIQEQSLPEGRIYFSAGGSIYSVKPDGAELRVIIEGDRGDARDHDKQRRWASSPSVSPDGATLAFVRNYDVWLSDIDGSNQRLLIDAGDWALDPDCVNCASNWSSGASSVAWSGSPGYLTYVIERIGGSGISELWHADLETGVLTRVLDDDAGFMLAPLADEGKRFVNDRTLAVDSEGMWLRRPFTEEKPIVYGRSRDSQVSTGVGPAPSSDKRWVSYLRGDELRLVSAEGEFDRLVLDLAPLGGRDRHFASTPDCFPERKPGCSFRPPVLAWGP